MPNVCSALESRTLQQEANVTLVGRQGPSNSSTVLFTFQLIGDAVLDRAALERLRTIFVSRYPDFLPGAFGNGTGKFFENEDAYKRPIVAEGGRLDYEPLGRKICDAITAKEVNLLGDFRVLARLGGVRTRQPGALEASMGQLARDERSVEEAADAFLAVVWPLFTAGDEASQPYADSRMLPTLVLALVRPDQAIAIRYQPFANAGRMLLGNSLFANAPLSREEHSAVLAMCRGIFDVMRDEWRWSPRDLWDVQSFIWVTCRESSQPAFGGDPEKVTERNVASPPTNLILYGPPGTGKTYASIEEAVRLCETLDRSPSSRSTSRIHTRTSSRASGRQPTRRTAKWRGQGSTSIPGRDCSGSCALWHSRRVHALLPRRSTLAAGRCSKCRSAVEVTTLSTMLPSLGTISRWDGVATRTGRMSNTVVKRPFRRE
jgi:hypothetical protein